MNTSLTFGGFRAVYIVVGEDVYIAVKKSDVDEVSMKYMTSFSRDIPASECPMCRVDGKWDAVKRHCHSCGFDNRPPSRWKQFWRLIFHG